MKKSTILFCVMCLLCGVLTACTQTPASTHITDDFVTIPNSSNPAVWYFHSHIPPQPLTFSSADDMISFIYNRDLSQVDGFEYFGLPEETAYNHAIYSLWGVGYFPILGNYKDNEYILFPMNNYESIGIFTNINGVNERFRIGFSLKTPFLVETLNTHYPQDCVTLLNSAGKEISAIFYRLSDRYRLILCTGNTYYVEVIEYITNERITAEELYEHYCDLEVEVEYIDLWDLRYNQS